MGALSFVRGLVGRDPLTELANRYGSDKGDKAHGRHRYASTYHSLFHKMRSNPMNLLEIGLLHPFDTKGKAARAPSLQMWREYFPEAALFGFDINDFSQVKMQRCTIFRGDMGSREDLLAMANTARVQFDIVIEDGSHASHHQQIALAALFPFVSPGGLYIIEDLHWQPTAIEAAPKTRDILRRAIAAERIASPIFSEQESTYLNSHVANITLYNSRDIFNRDNRDGLGVLRKKS